MLRAWNLDHNQNPTIILLNLAWTAHKWARHFFSPLLKDNFTFKTYFHCIQGYNALTFRLWIFCSACQAAVIGLGQHKHGIVYIHLVRTVTRTENMEAWMYGSFTLVSEVINYISMLLSMLVVFGDHNLPGSQLQGLLVAALSLPGQPRGESKIF